MKKIENQKELLMEKALNKLRSGVAPEEVIKIFKINDQESIDLIKITKILMTEKIDVTPRKSLLLDALNGTEKAPVTKKVETSYNSEEAHGRYSFEKLINIMNKTKVLIPAGFVILVLIITGISLNKSGDIVTINREFQEIDGLNSEFSNITNEETDNGDISTYLSSNSSVENYKEEISIEDDGTEINSIESSFNSLIDSEDQTNSISSSF